jgi:hypothetical protein
MALRERIGQFQRFVGKLQPILARLPREIAAATLRGEGEAARARLVATVTADASAAEADGFDLDAALDVAISEVPRRAPAYDLAALGTVLAREDLLPFGTEAKPADRASRAWLAPGLPQPVRVTTSRAYYEAHPESCELWSPGSPVFPKPDGIKDEPLDATAARRLLSRP